MSDAAHRVANHWVKCAGRNLREQLKSISDRAAQAALQTQRVGTMALEERLKRALENRGGFIVRKLEFRWIRGIVYIDIMIVVPDALGKSGAEDLLTEILGGTYPYRVIGRLDSAHSELWGYAGKAVE